MRLWAPEILSNETPRRGAGVVERGGLENRCGCKPTQGSNPCLSAIKYLKTMIYYIFFYLPIYLNIKNKSSCWTPILLDFLGSSGVQGSMECPHPSAKCILFIATPQIPFCKPSCIRMSQARKIVWRVLPVPYLKEIDARHFSWPFPP